ncbi:MAG: CDP-alcohol phosphatidyltransferase family protein [Lewinellaceae bacterium]|nr:CDP-alcohol phosphatidyltransferase family protein [Lewinellaceae bacterium]
MKQQIPNILTLLNLLAGCFAAVAALYGQPATAVVFLAVGLVADYLDGALARVLHVQSPVGKELDSLADLVTFGFAPACLLFGMLSGGSVFSFPADLPWRAFPAFILTAFSAYRLAKFNLDTRQSENFLGMPTPACATFTAGLALIRHDDLLGWGHAVGHPVFIYACLAVLCWLLISEVPMFSLKFKHFTWAGNEIKFIFAALALVIGAITGLAAPALVIGLYLLYNVFNWIKSKPHS